MTSTTATPANTQKNRVYDLEDRTLRFAQQVRSFVGQAPRSLANLEDIKQLVRASGSVGANYIEANDALGKKDFLMRIKIARKEAKESIFWLKLMSVSENQSHKNLQQDLISEATELVKIFSAIAKKV